jgi:hypothetical protein
MRRALLISSLAVAGLAPISASAVSGSGRKKTDRRLIGTWRSDRERTVKLWRYNKEVDAEAMAKFESIFGKLTWRITPSHWHGEFENDRFSGPYSVIASDQRSAVVLHPGADGA